MDRAEASGIILAWHITVFVGRPGDRAAGKAASVFENTKFFLGNFLEPFVDLFAWGILERHPKLRIVMAEAGTGWLPWLIQELDYRHWRLWEAKEFWADKGGSALVTKPSELFRRQIYATFQEDYVALSLLPFFGEGRLLWASDYPHPDSVWPNSSRPRLRPAVGGRFITTKPARSRCSTWRLAAILAITSSARFRRLRPSKSSAKASAAASS